ncbi:hypothetical protein JXQ31_03220 [candidate division KSB1 bacterium]|nr:hypothetical protein [candidate division KSB1 bacterium]
MPDVLPKGEKSRRAVQWISANLQNDSERSLWKLVQEAINRFDLNPMEAEMLMQFYRENN